MKQIIFLSLALTSIFSGSFAVDRIYNIGFTTAIMADDTEWICNVKSDHNYLVYPSQKQYIQGVSKHFPLTFLFYDENGMNIENFLKEFAVKTNTLITNVKTIQKQNEHIVDCEFYNGVSSGHIRFSRMTFENRPFMMVKKIDSKLLDEHSRENLYQCVHDLITPLYNPKALSLWLESVESNLLEK